MMRFTVVSLVLYAALKHSTCLHNPLSESTGVNIHMRYSPTTDDARIIVS